MYQVGQKGVTLSLGSDRLRLTTRLSSRMSSTSRMLFQTGFLPPAQPNRYNSFTNNFNATLPALPTFATSTFARHLHSPKLRRSRDKTLDFLTRSTILSGNRAQSHVTYQNDSDATPMSTPLPTAPPTSPTRPTSYPWLLESTLPPRNTFPTAAITDRGIQPLLRYRSPEHRVVRRCLRTYTSYYRYPSTNRSRIYPSRGCVM